MAKLWEVIDVDEAIVYHACTEEERDYFQAFLELLNHRLMVKEVLL